MYLLSKSVVCIVPSKNGIYCSLKLTQFLPILEPFRFWTQEISPVDAVKTESAALVTSTLANLDRSCNMTEESGVVFSGPILDECIIPRLH